MERERYGVSDDKEAECMSLVSPSVSLVLHSLSSAHYIRFGTVNNIMIPSVDRSLRSFLVSYAVHLASVPPARLRRYDTRRERRDRIVSDDGKRRKGTRGNVTGGEHKKSARFPTSSRLCRCFGRSLLSLTSAPPSSHEVEVKGTTK